MSKRKKVLIFAEAATLAHPTRMAVFANKLSPEQFEVHFACPKSYHAMLGLTHAQPHDLNSISTAEFVKRLYLNKFPYTLNELEEQKIQNENLINELKPDLVISDFRLSLPVTAKKMKLPHINVNHYYWHPNYASPPLIPKIVPSMIFGRKLALMTEPFLKSLILGQQLKTPNAFLTKNNIDPVNNIFEFYSLGDFIFFPDIEMLYGSDLKIKPTEMFIGPLIWRSEQQKPTWWEDLDKKKPIAFISMGSSGEAKNITRIVDATLDHGYQVILSTAGKDALTIKNKNLWQEKFISAEHALSISELLICNGGTPSTYHALEKGVAILGFPVNLDHYRNVDLLKRNHLCEYVNFDEINKKNLNAKLSQIKNRNVNQQQLAKNAIQNYADTIDLNQIIHKII